MPHSLYVCLQDEDKIAPFTIDADSGRLTPQAAVPVQGGPAFLALSPDRRVLYVGIASGQLFRASESTKIPARSRHTARSQWNTHPRFWPLTVRADIYCRLIIKA